MSFLLKAMFLAFLAFFLVGCAKQEELPELFIPRTKAVDGTDIDAKHEASCRNSRVNLTGELITHENFLGVFECANYNKDYEPLRALVTSPDFPPFLKNIGQVLKNTSSENQELNDVLKSWIKEGREGESRADRLLATLSKIIKNPAFQAALPVLSGILDHGRSVWDQLLPAVADVIYQPGYKENLTDIMNLFGNATDDDSPNAPTRAQSLKKFANLLKADVDGKTFSQRALEVIDDLNRVELPGTSVAEFLRKMNDTGVFYAMYIDNGELRGEEIDSNLNSSPDFPGDKATPLERQERAYRKLYSRGKDGSPAPITQLAGMVAEFNKPHNRFFENLALWINSREGIDTISGIIVKSLIDIASEQILTSPWTYNDCAKAQGLALDKVVTREETATFLGLCIASPEYASWLSREVARGLEMQFKLRNAEMILARTDVQAQTLALFRAVNPTAYTAEAALPLKEAIKAFTNNLHKLDVKFAFGDQNQAIQDHVSTIWYGATRTALGDAIVVDYAFDIVATVLASVDSDLAAGKHTIAQWYFEAVYGNPGTSELLAFMAFNGLNLLKKIEKNKAYLHGEFAEKYFVTEDDRRAFRLLVDQAPNIWTYIKSGASRSGNNLTRALSLDGAAEDNYLIKTYVNLISVGYETGIIDKGVRLIQAHHENTKTLMEKPVRPKNPLEHRKKLSFGAMALTRVLERVFTPLEGEDYETSTLRKLFVPFRSIAAPANQADTAKFLHDSADELLKASDDTLNDFFGKLKEKTRPTGRLATEAEVDANTRLAKDIAEVLKRKELPAVVHGLSDLFKQDAIKPALDFLQQKTDDGSLKKLLELVRKLLWR